MNDQLFTYIKHARQKGLKDQAIAANLIIAGWNPELARAGLEADVSLPAPKPPAEQTSERSSSLVGSAHPTAVVNLVTARGLEYIIQFIALGVAAVSGALLIHAGIDGIFGGSGSDFYGIFDADNSSSLAAFIVSLPLFLLLFMRLQRAEQHIPSLHADLSRKRAIQLTLIVTFIIGLSDIIVYLYDLLSGSYAADGLSTSIAIISSTLHMLVTGIIAGGIFAYYWRDSHRLDADS